MKTRHLVITFTLLLTPTAESFALCTNGTGCPTSSASLHKLRLVGLFNSTELDMSPAHEILLARLGSTNPILVACVSNTLYRVDDLQDGGSIPIPELQAESFFCAGAGDDTVRVNDATTSCGPFTIFAFDYGGFPLRLYGQGGSDELRGGPGEELICGGDGSDDLSGGGGDDELDGWSGCDYLYDVTGVNGLYGYDGADFLIDWAAYGTLMAEGGDYDCLMSGANSLIGDCGSGFDGYERTLTSHIHDCELPVSCISEWGHWAHNQCPADR